MYTILMYLYYVYIILMFFRHQNNKNQSSVIQRSKSFLNHVSHRKIHIIIVRSINNIVMS